MGDISFELTDEFQSTTDEVFAAMGDLESWHLWMPNFVRVERVDGAACAVGAAFLETRKMFGKEATEHFEITAWEPGRAIGYHIDGTKGASGKVQYYFDYTLTPDGSGQGTLMTLKGRMAGLGFFGRIMGRMMKGMFTKQIAKDHAALRAYLAKA